jgi:DNA-binding transcriptional MerR regulator/methylmalonyl-CoA mutase cobalamin-binding subunit
VVSARTGISQDVLRAWEKRYQAVVPQRGATGRRLYSDLDVERLRLMKRLEAGGHRISDVAGLSLESLTVLAEEDQAERAGSPARPMGSVPTAEATGRQKRDGHVDEALSALEALDKARLEAVLADAAVELSTPALRRQVVAPLLHAIGDRWHEGTLRIVHEHLASVLVRSFIAGISKGNGRSPAAPRMLVTTPAGQRHELGALLTAAAAEEQGWDVYYLGPDLPAEEIAVAVRQLHPRVVALSVVYQNGSFALQEELRKLRRYLDPEVGIIVGGRAVSALRPVEDETGITVVEDLDALQDTLIALQS